MEKVYYGHDELQQDLKELLKSIKQENFDAIVAIARGGMTIAHILAEGLDLRNCFSINSIHYDDTQKLDTIQIFNIPDLADAKKVLIVDDIVDSGDTMIEVLKVFRDKYSTINFKTGAIFYKTTALIKPDFYVKESNDWIDFFWVNDLK